MAYPDQWGESVTQWVLDESLKLAPRDLGEVALLSAGLSGDAPKASKWAFACPVESLLDLPPDIPAAGLGVEFTCALSTIHDVDGQVTLVPAETWTVRALPSGEVSLRPSGETARLRAGEPKELAADLAALMSGPAVVEEASGAPGAASTLAELKASYDAISEEIAADLAPVEVPDKVSYEIKKCPERQEQFDTDADIALRSASLVFEGDNAYVDFLVCGDRPENATLIDTSVDVWLGNQSAGQCEKASDDWHASLYDVFPFSVYDIQDSDGLWTDAKDRSFHGVGLTIDPTWTTDKIGLTNHDFGAIGLVFNGAASKGFDCGYIEVWDVMSYDRGILCEGDWQGDDYVVECGNDSDYDSWTSEVSLNLPIPEPVTPWTIFPVTRLAR
jgi:hypothetical protein